MASHAEDRLSGWLQRIVVLLLVVLVLVGVWTFLHSGKSEAQQEPKGVTSTGFVAAGALPGAARAAVRRIDAGGPFPAAADGTVYDNAAHHLPNQPAGYYHRYGVSGSSAIVQGSDGVLYYTSDGYRSFRQIRR